MLMYVFCKILDVKLCVEIDIVIFANDHILPVKHMPCSVCLIGKLFHKKVL